MCAELYPACATPLEALHFFVAVLPKEKRKILLHPFPDVFIHKDLNYKLSVLSLYRVDPIASASPSLPIHCQIGDVPAAPHMMLTFPCTLSLNVSLAAKGSFPFWSGPRWLFLCFPSLCGQITVPFSETGAHSWSSSTASLWEESQKQESPGSLSDRATSWSPKSFPRMPLISVF